MSQMVLCVLVGFACTTRNEIVFTILLLVLRALRLQIFGVEDTTPMLYGLFFELRIIYLF